MIFDRNEDAMNRPYVVCHMMASLDGRIDCDMTEQIGSDGYYEALGELDIDTSIEGKGTAVKHYAEPERFLSKDATPVGKTDFYKSHEAKHWDVICDTHGTLRYSDYDTKERLVLTSEQASNEYLNYLKSREISYIAVGKDHIDLAKALDMLYDEFGSRRVGVVGGGHINAGFLQAGLLDEVSIVYGSAIDGREGFTCVFDGVPADHIHPWLLKLYDVQRMNDDSVWLRYKTAVSPNVTEK